MRITLPSGAWIEVKDSTVPGDRFAVIDAPEVYVEDGKTVVLNAAGNQWKAFLSRIITGWSYQESQQVPVPAVAGPQVLDEYPDNDDDIDALDDALRARYERIIARRRPNPPRPQPPTTGTSSGS